MDRRLLTVLVAFAITGCAGIGVRTEGVSGSVAWYVTDLELAKRMIEGQEREVYSFTLVLKETTGTEISFTRIERTVYGPDTGSSSVADTGRWELPAYCERRFPFSVYFDTSAGVTAPLWNVILTGTNDQGQKVRLAIDIALPSEPSATETVKAQARA